MTNPVADQAIDGDPLAGKRLTGAGLDTARISPPLSHAAGVRVIGVDLAKPLSEDLRELILRAFLEHHVLVFPDQNLTREEQYAFTANFGDIEPHLGRIPNSKRFGVAHVISNLDGDGKPVDRSFSPVSNYRWHTDKAYYAVPPMMTALHAVEVPPEGGDTEFANTEMGYAALPEETKRQIAGLRVVFQWGASGRERSGGPLPDAAIRQRPPVDHPLVRTHPETGKRALYLGNHASHVLGMPEADGVALLEQLLEHTTKPRFTYAHRWRRGDLLIWDNRCLLHRAVANFEMGRYRRILHRSVVRGTVPF